MDSRNSRNTCLVAMLCAATSRSVGSRRDLQNENEALTRLQQGASQNGGPHLGGSQNWGYHFRGPIIKDYSILRSILESPYFGKLPFRTKSQKSVLLN